MFAAMPSLRFHEPDANPREDIGTSAHAALGSVPRRAIAVRTAGWTRPSGVPLASEWSGRGFAGAAATALAYPSSRRRCSPRGRRTDESGIADRRRVAIKADVSVGGASPGVAPAVCRGIAKRTSIAHYGAGRRRRWQLRGQNGM
jgi:hypothetical protein